MWHLGAQDLFRLTHQRQNVTGAPNGLLVRHESVQRQAILLEFMGPLRHPAIKFVLLDEPREGHGYLRAPDVPSSQVRFGARIG
ncbi:hypothetical protein GCM10008960_41570 [Deinococcus sedimenti]|uniref:Uncharacterized protein n=1 Tax=Deinococcus sedimenti TaxID=1867090 RepID=A0ABQ2SBI1_9DEIO|nr:hypothetical protein GCM10008960_41570 [Deinococcus sedimenti]